MVVSAEKSRRQKLDIVRRLFPDEENTSSSEAADTGATVGGRRIEVNRGGEGGRRHVRGRESRGFQIAIGDVSRFKSS